MRDDAPGVSSSGAAKGRAPHHPLNLKILVAASPGILLVWTQIWLGFAVLVWAFGHYIVPGLTGELIVGLLLIAPAIIMSWKIAVHAVASETELEADTQVF